MQNRFLAGALSAALLSGCGGGSAPNALPINTQGGTATVGFVIHVPGSSVQTAHGRKPLYISRDTRGIGIDFDAYNGGAGAYNHSPNTSPAVAASLAPGATGCDASAGADGSFSCTVYAPGVPIGYDSFRFTLWNAAPAGGNFTAGGDVALSVATLDNHPIIKGLTNTISTVGLTLDPVVYNVSVQLSEGIVDGTPDAANGLYAEVTLKDAQGNIIIGSDQLIDYNGNTMSVTLNLNNNHTDAGANCPSASPTAGCALYFAAPANFTNAAAASTAIIHYDGNYAFPTSGANVPSVYANVSGSLPGSDLLAKFSVTQSNSGSVSIPQAPQYTAATAAFSGVPGAMAIGSDGNIYVTVGGGALEYFTPCGITPCAVTNVTSIAGSPGGVAAGPDGYIWYTDVTSQKIAKQPPGASGTPVLSAAIASGNITGIVAGPDGNMWFEDAGNKYLDSINPNTMTITQQYNLGTAPLSDTIAAGTFASGQQAVCTAWGSTVGCDGIGTGVSSLALSSTVNGLAFGPDGMLYATVNDGTVQSLYWSGSLQLGYTYTLTSGDVALGIAAGHDGAMWFTEKSGGVLGRIAIESTGNPEPASAGSLSEWNENPGVQFPASTSPGFIQFDASGNLWISDVGLTNKTVDEVTP